MEDVREYTYWARTAQKRISRELAELKGTNDRKRLSELYILATSSHVGIGQIVSEDDDIEGIESESSEELAAERAMWESLNELAEIADAVKAELHRVDDTGEGVDSEEGVDNLSAASKKVAERWFSRQEAS